MKTWVIILFLQFNDQPFYHPVMVDKDTCHDPHQSTLLEHRIVKDKDGVKLDRFFYRSYMVFGHFCAGVFNDRL